jgi:hypothetical protein
VAADETFFRRSSASVKQWSEYARLSDHLARQAAVVKALLERGGAARPPKQTPDA